MRCREEIAAPTAPALCYAIGIIEQIYHQHNFHCIVIGVNGGERVRLRARNLGVWQPMVLKLMRERLEWMGFEFSDLGGCFEVSYAPKENQSWIHRVLT